jgi:hypothetical protein
VGLVGAGCGLVRSSVRSTLEKKRIDPRPKEGERANASETMDDGSSVAILLPLIGH